MFAKQVCVSAAVATMVSIGFALAPANADQKELAKRAAKQTGTIVVALASSGPAQDQVARYLMRIPGAAPESGDSR
jgi:hypothetical protein